jgi:hypothetical protein
MRGSKHDVPVAFEDMGFCSRQAEWGDMNVALETAPAGLDTTPVFRGLPDDRCQCAHWGYLVQGQFRVRYGDHEEVVKGGDVYYLSPGHNVLFDAPSELVEFSPRGEYHKTMEVAARNIAALQAQAASH